MNPLLQSPFEREKADRPIFCWKRALPGLEERAGLMTISWRSSGGRVFKTYFTRLDQALLLWGGVTSIIFLTAQFSSLDWLTQAFYDSLLTIAATAMTVCMTWQWASVKRVRWILGIWSIVMMSAIGLSDYSIVVGNGLILQHLCTGWLSACALGYFITAIGLRSRAMMLVGFVHLGAVAACGSFLPWQFLLTGSVLTCSLWMLGILQWDHR